MSGTTTKFLYDGWNVIQEQGSSGTPTANLITGLGLDEVFSRTDSAGARSFLADPLGSTIALADTSGVVQTSYTYEAFGKATQSGQTSTNPFQFTGRESDGAAGLYSFRARYLNPTYGRFVSEDPIGFAGGDVNLYAYVGNGPTTRTDRVGLVGYPPFPPGPAEQTSGRKDTQELSSCGFLGLGCLPDAWDQVWGAWEGLRKDWEFVSARTREVFLDPNPDTNVLVKIGQCAVGAAQGGRFGAEVGAAYGLPGFGFGAGAVFGCIVGLRTPVTPPS